MVHGDFYIERFLGNHSSLLAHYPFERDALGEIDWNGVCKWCGVEIENS